LAEDPRALDSLHDPGTEGNYVLEHIMEGLLNATPDGQLVPELAEDLPEMLDEKTYVFKLRQGVKFHDDRVRFRGCQVDL
jgi:peptide/nickel transport system substrate-binding protein